MIKINIILKDTPKKGSVDMTTRIRPDNITTHEYLMAASILIGISLGTGDIKDPEHFDPDHIPPALVTLTKFAKMAGIKAEDIEKAFGHSLDSC